MATAARQSLKIGLIPADGIGREVIPVCLICCSSYILWRLTTCVQAAKQALEALGSDIPKVEFHDLLAGFELFTRTGEALPEDTVQYVTQIIERRYNSVVDYMVHMYQNFKGGL